jgi:hypothetical protein
VKQYVIAKQIGVDHAARQVIMAVVSQVDFRFEQVCVFGAEERIDLRCDGAPPLRPSRLSRYP